MSTRPADPALHSDRSESAAEWLVLHKQRVLMGVAAILILFGGAWFYRRSGQIKAERAESAYFQARQAMASGNAPLALTDLRNVTTRYKGTPGAAQAALTIAQILYDQGKFQEGMAELEKVAGSRPEELAPSVHVMLGAGYEGLRQFDKAAAEYQTAAELTRFPNDAAAFKANAARAFMAGGKPDSARVIWTALAAEPEGSMVPEARVRLGELTSAPVAPATTQ
ncbi:MAG TPA: tetratricopeptide repeat protein [Gemmatimonadaceae bacterium]|nr:tetratricopeptide repeat protein [Gemmatimonadaceae bacterium]